jgi:hypothetical protein
MPSGSAIVVIHVINVVVVVTSTTIITFSVTVTVVVTVAVDVTATMTITTVSSWAVLLCMLMFVGACRLISTLASVAASAF